MYNTNQKEHFKSRKLIKTLLCVQFVWCFFIRRPDAIETFKKCGIESTCKHIEPFQQPQQIGDKMILWGLFAQVVYKTDYLRATF